MKLLQRTLLLSLLLVLPLLQSCGGRPIGYGVLLWAPEESPIANGALLEILEESQLNSTYTVTTAELEEDVTVPMWRVERFEEQEGAMEYAAAYAPYVDSFARSQRQALPVRAEQDRLSPDVYRLREDELMKILDRSEEPSDEAGFEGYWYQVLTREGVRGWAFGYFLELTDSSGDARPEENEAGGGGETDDIERILANVWRPAYFREMINRGQVDLGRLSTSYGLFPDEENRELRIVLPEHTATFSYTEFFRAAPSRYGLEGSPVTISVRGERTISVQYTLNGREQSAVFVLLDREIPEIVEEEMERRRELRERFSRDGNSLVSTAYGEIELLEGGQFVWSGYDRLTPTVIPERAAEGGTITFPLFLSEDLQEEYDGAVLFTFDGEGGPVAVRFIYEYTDAGVRLTYVPPQDVAESVVQREAFSPIVIFFSYESR